MAHVDLQLLGRQAALDLKRRVEMAQIVDREGSLKAIFLVAAGKPFLDQQGVLEPLINGLHGFRPALAVWEQKDGLRARPPIRRRRFDRKHALNSAWRVSSHNR
jgi:hypothetical protein